MYSGHERLNNFLTSTSQLFTYSVHNMLCENEFEALPFRLSRQQDLPLTVV